MDLSASILKTTPFVEDNETAGASPALIVSSFGAFLASLHAKARLTFKVKNLTIAIQREQAEDTKPAWRRALDYVKESR